VAHRDDGSVAAGCHCRPPQQAREKSGVHRLVEDTDAILLPSHDSDLPARLAGW